MVKKYPQIDTWCVTGEFNNPYGQNQWEKIFGLNDLKWLKQAFETAHEANPQAKLYYSDFEIEFGGEKANSVFDMVSTLKQMNTPITSIAFQMHLYGKEFVDPSTRQQKMEQLKTEIARYKAIGIEVIVPEMDISMHEVGSDISLKLQAQIEHDVILALLEAGVTDINHFGITDKLNWKQQEANGGGPDSLATNFDLDGKPKLNYYSDMQAIMEFLSQKGN